MPERILGLNSKQLVIAAKTCLAVMIGYGLALRYQWNASNVATTIIVLQTAEWGATVQKAARRLTGTLAGAILGVVLVAVCSSDRNLFIACMSLLTGFCVWQMQTSKNSYAWMLVLLTCAIVGWPAATNPLTTFQTSVDRVTAVVVGVLLSGLSQSLFWPLTSSGQYRQSLIRLVSTTLELLKEIETAIHSESSERQLDDSTASKLLGFASNLDAQLELARSDFSELRNRSHQCMRLNEYGHELALAGTMLHSALDTTINDFRNKPDALQFLVERLRQAIKQCDQLSTNLKEFDFISPERTSQLDVFADQNDEQCQTLDSRTLASQDLATNCLAQLGSALDNISKQLNLVRSDEQESSQLKRDDSPSASFWPRAKKSILAATQVGVAASFIVYLNWPAGLQASMLLIMIFAFMNAQLPVAMLWQTVVKSLLIALPLAAVFHFTIMPRVDTFAQLSPWLLLFFLPPLYLAASPNPSTATAAKLSVLVAKSLISLGTTPPSYSFASFSNAYLGVVGGCGIVMFLAYLFETRSPQKMVLKLLTAMFSKMGEQLNRRGPEVQVPAGPLPLKNHALLKELANLKKVVALVNVRLVSGIDKHSIAELTQNLNFLVAHSLWLERNRSLLLHQDMTLMPAFQEGLDQLSNKMQALMGRLAKTGNLGSRVLSQAETDSNLESNSDVNALAGFELQPVTRQFYASLTQSIKNCNQSIQRIDWPAWQFDRF